MNILLFIGMLHFTNEQQRLQVGVLREVRESLLGCKHTEHIRHYFDIEQVSVGITRL